MENGVIYSGGGLPSNIWLNYLLNFENIFVLGRRSNNTKDKKVISSHDNVNFHLTQNYTSVKDLIFNISKIKEEISTLIEKVDLVLIRLPSVLGFIAGEIALKKIKKYGSSKLETQMKHLVIKDHY
ncbi:hypothetical protein [Chryseobacterium sp. POE27]|uniref:hypothetical protein n=1 Tax=Chryseobacterium sp. POE27 TaxID=3138177 RepID=UPI00321BF026